MQPFSQQKTITFYWYTIVFFLLSRVSRAGELAILQQNRSWSWNINLKNLLVKNWVYHTNDETWIKWSNTSMWKFIKWKERLITIDPGLHDNNGSGRKLVAVVSDSLCNKLNSMISVFSPDTSAVQHTVKKKETNQRNCKAYTFDTKLMHCCFIELNIKLKSLHYIEDGEFHN
jgi:hypothetical protein